MADHDEVVDAYRQRKRRNDESKAWATRDGDLWTDGEEEILLQYWIDVHPDDRDERAISQLLERTIEACRVRCEAIRAAHGLSNVRMTQTTITVTKVVKGWLVGYCFGCGRLTDVFSDGNVSRCEDCKE